jgi:hypothetical protein
MVAEGSQSETSRAGCGFGRETSRSFWVGFELFGRAGVGRVGWDKRKTRLDGMSRGVVWLVMNGVAQGDRVVL